MKYPIGTIGIVLDDRKAVMDNAIKMFSGTAAHVFCIVGDNLLMEMHCPKGAITRPLDDYRKKSKTILMATPLFLKDQQRVILKDHLMEMVKRKVKYDFKGILGQLITLPDVVNSKERYYCSEAVGEAFAVAAGYYFMDLSPKIQTPSQHAYDVETRSKFGKNLWDRSFLKCKAHEYIL